jgi:CheY-like chemotaxis protein
VHTTAVGSAQEALTLLRQEEFDCLVLDLRLPDLPGRELIGKIKGELRRPDLPIIVYTGKDLTAEEEAWLRGMTQTIIAKDARSLDKLLDKTALFLHRIQARLPEPVRHIVEQGQKAEPRLAGKKILIVDDDLRNLFALTSMLERWQIEVFRAENGTDGLAILAKNPDIEAVLMDIMMPGMDGYQVIQTIRKDERWNGMPVIALTAKAMQGDRSKCLAAGASDYIAKPVSGDKLLSMLRVWLGLEEAAARPQPVG